VTGLLHERRHAYVRVPDTHLEIANAGRLSLCLRLTTEKQLPLRGSWTYRVEGEDLGGTRVTLTWEGPGPYDEADEGEPEETLYVRLDGPRQPHGRALGGLTPFSEPYRLLRASEVIELWVDELEHPTTSVRWTGGEPCQP
jgi:hypothetical protein